MQTDAAAKFPLNDVQVALLRLFSREMTSAEMLAIRKILLEYYDQELQDEVGRAIQDKKIERKDFDRLLNQHQRTK